VCSSDLGAAGARGTVSYSTGYAYRLEALADTLLSTDGMVTNRISALNTSIDDVESRRDTMGARLAIVEQRYRDQFTALDTMLASMNSTSSFLQQQLANLPKIGS
jgi:flagellar hook-associated protein 2